MKSDPRVRYTRMIIQNAYLELLKQKTANKITVREICERAEINRSTFYRYYLDCYDLFDKLKEDALTQLEDMLSTIDEKGAEATLLAILAALESAGPQFDFWLKNEGSDDFIHEVIRRCFRFMDLRLPSPPDSIWNNEQRDMGYAFLTGGASSVIEYWLRDGCRESKEQVAAVIMTLSNAVTGELQERAFDIPDCEIFPDTSPVPR